jgi:branched-chain amino acid aminotransferase
MVLLNGSIISRDQALIGFNNRGTYYGDGVFETIRCFNGAPLLFEAHYFRLMSSMRILRMDIPNQFTPEYIEHQIQQLLEDNGIKNNHARVRMTVWRNTGGYYTPSDRGVQFAMEVNSLPNQFINTSNHEVELFKDHQIMAGMLSTLKTTQKMVNILAGIYAQENEYQDLFLINQNKMIVEMISGNVFIRSGSVIKTPPIEDGCLKGIMREQVINQLKKMMNYTIEETTVTPFELQRADEIFTTNAIKGIQSIHKYRKKEFTTDTADELIEFFNDLYFN